MHQPKKLGLIANLILLFVLQTLGADKYTDENRPYEFGFKIDGQQHRHESKDTDGIIMGEFGFVTADDVYHVTVYATDKEGRFKILAMKNIHLKSTSASELGALTSARQGHALTLPPAPAASVKVSAVTQEPLKKGGVSIKPRLGPFTPQAGPVSQGVITPQPGKPPKSIEPPANSCSSCSRPTTTTRAPPPAYNQVTDNNNYNSPKQIGALVPSSRNQGAVPYSPGQQNNAQGGPISLQNNPSSPRIVPQRELVAPNGAQPDQAVQNNPGSPSYSQGPSVSSTPNNLQRGPSGTSYNAQGHKSYPTSQQNTPQSGFVASDGAQSFAPQPSQVPQYNPGSPSYSQGPSVSNAPNNLQRGPSGSSYNAQGQKNYPTSQQNILQGGFVAPDGAQSFAPQPGQVPQNYPGSPSYSQEPSIPNTPKNTQDGPSGSSYRPQDGQQNYPPIQQNIPQGEIVAPGGVKPFAAIPEHISQNNPGLPSYSQGPSIPSAPKNTQGRPSGLSFNAQGNQQNYPTNQQNSPQGGFVAPGSAQSFAPQPGLIPQKYPDSSSYSQGPSISTALNNVQDGPSDSSYNVREGQQTYPSNRQNIPKGGLVSPDSAQSLAPQPGQIPQDYSGSLNYSQGTGISNAPNNVQGGSSISSYRPQDGHKNYPSIQQNIPQGEIVAPGGVKPFVSITEHTSQNNPGLPSYSRGPTVLNAPNNYAQPGGVGQQGGLLPTNSGEQNRLFGGNNNPYAGAGPSGSASSVPDSGNFGQNIAQQAGLFGPVKAQSTGKSSHPQGAGGERTSKQYNPNLGPNGSKHTSAAIGVARGSAKPMLLTAQMQIVDKNTDIYALGPNEQKGLPPGLSLGDVTQLLYTFNYTVGFHGHFEEGYANGAKQGYYYVTGRNGVRTRIDYTADDTGFHPKVSQEVLDLLSEEVPKPETEKDEKYGLKGYEFKWLYYPVETK